VIDVHIEGADDRPDPTLDTSWMAHGECRGMDAKLFHPERGEDTRQAKEVCRDCVVRPECLEYALANGEKLGIWGGASERERRAMRRVRNVRRSPLPIRHGTVRGAQTHRDRGEVPCLQCKEAVNAYAADVRARLRERLAAS
jgi:WhiB family redox-sensing transcriptional regulator